jgi:hypothetical protein
MAKREKYGPDIELATDDELSMVLEVFDIDAEVEGATDAPFQALSDDEIQGVVGQAVDDAVDFIESEIAERRLKSTRYFNGEVDIGHEDARSSVVATKCRDTVRAVKPSIQRIFMTADRPVEFVPQGPEDVASMEQAGTYAAAKFRQNNGFQILRDVTHDALVNITGFTKAHWSDYAQVRVYTYADLDELQYQAVIDSPDVEILSEVARTDDATVQIMQEQIDAAMQMAQQAAAMGQPVDSSQLPQMPNPLPQLYDLRILRRTPLGKLVIETVPPEDFFIDRNARSDDDFYVIGHRAEMRAADVIAMGIDEADVLDLDSASSADTRDQEDEERRRYSTNRDESENSADPAMKLVTITEAYMRVDVDGTGEPILHKFILGGSANKLLAYEPVDDHPFASWHVDPEPHTFFGRSLVEIIEQDQDAATAVLRGILDNVQMTNNPRVEAVKGMVEMDDLLNNEIGAVVRVSQPGMIRDLAVPFVAGQTLTALQYIDNMVEVKTGVTRASMGLDPDALQSTTKAAVAATVSAGAGQVEVMVANLAYTGMRRLFKQILKLMSQHSTRAEMMRINGSYVALDPRVWDSELDAEVNVGLGTGREEQRAAILGQVLQLQLQAIQTFGPDNPLAGLPQMRNTLADLLSINGVHNSDRHFLPTQPPQPAQPQPQQPQQGDPSQALVQAETIKAQAKMASDSARLQLDLYKAQLADDRERDRMAQDMELAMAQIAGKYGIAVDTARIKAEQALTQTAMPMGAPGAPAAPAAPQTGMPMPPDSGAM